MYLFFINKKDWRRREGFKKEMYTPIFSSSSSEFSLIVTSRIGKNLCKFARSKLRLSSEFSWCWHWVNLHTVIRLKIDSVSSQLWNCKFEHVSVIQLLGEEQEERRHLNCVVRGIVSFESSSKLFVSKLINGSFNDLILDFYRSFRWVIFAKKLNSIFEIRMGIFF